MIRLTVPQRRMTIRGSVPYVRYMFENDPSKITNTHTRIIPGTLLNSVDVSSCQVCMSPRPAPKNLFASKKIEYKWQFEDGAQNSGEWRDYMSADSASLEKAFAAKSPTTQITNRWGT